MANTSSLPLLRDRDQDRGPTIAPVLVILLAIVLLGHLTYRWALPRPIPGIPYNDSAAHSILGDMPSLVAHISKTKRIWPWISQQTIHHQSPIAQVFARPFSKPWVLLSDFRESQDILLRRTKEFDRSNFIGDVFLGLLPECHLSMKSDDGRFKGHRNLLKDLMTPGFLHEVEAPQIYSNVETLVKLWDLKSQLAQGHPFPAVPDMYNATLDSVFAATFGLEVKNSTTTSQLEHLLSCTSVHHLELPVNVDMPAEFPKSRRPAAFDALITLAESLEASVKAPAPRLAHWVLRQMPYMRKARAVKEELFFKEVAKGAERLISGDQVKRSALDDVLHRELAIAKKEGRDPVYHSRAIYDELFVFILGGHDTTSTTLSWALKHLTSFPEVQSALRSRLRKAYSAAVNDQRNPTAKEITSIPVPYLDATIEEIARTACIFPGVVRNVTVDTTVLGCAIPKGTDIFLLQNGPGYFAPPFPVPDSWRHESSLSAKYQVGSWTPDADDMRRFRPERWLMPDDDGEESFNALAGPHLAFGLGPRACFGRRLAYLQMRIFVVMLLWNFQLQPCPEELSSFEAVDKMSSQPTQCYVRLARAIW